MTSYSTKLQHGFSIIATLLALMILLLAYINTTDSGQAFNKETTTLLGDNWSCEIEGRAAETLSLPANIDATSGERIVISRTLPSDLRDPAVLCFRSSQQKVRVMFAGEELYSFGTDTNNQPFGKSPGSVWNIVRLPEGLASQSISIELVSPYASYSGMLHEVRVGSKASLMFYLLETHLPALVITGIILLIGLVLIILYFLYIRKNESSKAVFYLGCFAVLVSLWLFGESKMIQFFGDHIFSSTTLTFIAMLSFPIAITKYICCLDGFSYNRAMTLFTTALYMQLFVVCLLQLFNIYDFVEMLPAVHLVMLISALAALYMLLLDAFRKHNLRIRRTISALLILCIFSMLETTAYYFAPPLSTGNFMRMGVLIFIIMQSLSVGQSALQIFRLSREATRDGLTGCQNRTAYAKKIENLRNADGVSTIMADLNGLKYINDTFGHAAGDEAIILFARCFSEVFSAYGDCYRIGGDEFVFICRLLNQTQIGALMKAFSDLCAYHSRRTRYPFAVAIGHAQFDHQHDKSIRDTIRRADQLMYSHKKMVKNQMQ